jgi:hypothetical protein
MEDHGESRSVGKILQERKMWVSGMFLSSLLIFATKE